MIGALATLVGAKAPPDHAEEAVIYGMALIQPGRATEMPKPSTIDGSQNVTP